MNSLVVLSHTLTTRKDNKDKLLVHKLNLAGFYAVLGRQRERTAVDCSRMFAFNCPELCFCSVQHLNCWISHGLCLKEILQILLVSETKQKCRIWESGTRTLVTSLHPFSPVSMAVFYRRSKRSNRSRDFRVRSEAQLSNGPAELAALEVAPRRAQRWGLCAMRRDNAGTMQGTHVISCHIMWWHHAPHFTCYLWCTLCYLSKAQLVPFLSFLILCAIAALCPNCDTNYSKRGWSVRLSKHFQKTSVVNGIPWYSAQVQHSAFPLKTRQKHLEIYWQLMKTEEHYVSQKMYFIDTFWHLLTQ